MVVMNFSFGGFGLLESDFWSEHGIRIEARAEFLAAVEIKLRQFNRREFFGFDAFREFADGEIEDFFAKHQELLRFFSARRLLWQGLTFSRVPSKVSDRGQA